MAKQPYTAAQRDKLLDQLLADVAELKERLDHLAKQPSEPQPGREEKREAGKKRLAARQEIDTGEMDRQQVVMRPSVERVRRPDGKVVQRVVRPR